MAILYTPEYSNELLEFVQEVYAQDVKHYYLKLKLEKLIDLLEHAESLFELYRESLNKGQYEDCLLAYVIGAFYVFLIIPESVQFHARNKSYSIYTDLRKYYQEEINMSNVLLMVVRKVDSVLKKNLESITKVELDSSRKRAFSVEEPAIRYQLEGLHLNEKNSSSRESSSELIATEWTAPKLEPNDRLKLALSSAKTTESSSLNSFHLEENLVESHNTASVTSMDSYSYDNLDRVPFEKETSTDIRKLPRHGSLPSSKVAMKRDDSDASFVVDTMKNIDRYHTHRKDSYHSIYLSGETDDNLDNYTAGLARLQQENIIQCQQLFSILHDETLRYKILLIDLRFKKRFALNHLVAPNLINIDPHLLWIKGSEEPVQTIEELELLLNEPLFERRGEFEHIVYYTDNKSFMHLSFNYEFILFELFYKDKHSVSPKSLLGGYEQWKGFLNEHIKTTHFKKEDYLFRPYAKKPGDSTHSSEHTPAKLSPAPPPLPSTVPPPLTAIENEKSTNNTQRIPPIPKVNPPSVPQLKQNAHAPYNRGAAVVPIIKNSPAHEKRTVKAADHLQIHQHTHNTYPVPTIEKSSNEFVSLSITGLRNMGNTCYINAMLQCLFASTQFRDLFITAKYYEYLQSTDNNKTISKWFSLLFRKMYLNGGCSVVPNGFLKACHFLRPDFKIPDDQQDTQEFLLFLLDKLHDELSEPTKVANDYPNLILHDDEQLQVFSAEYDKWFDDNFKNNGLSPIDDIFQGQMENSLSCQRCGHASYNYSTFYVLSLAIPSVAPSKAFSKSKKIVKLEDCINLYTQDELLTGENAWDCPKCGSQSASVAKEDDEGEKKKKRSFLNVNGDSKSRSKFFKLSRSRSPRRSISPFRTGSSKQEKTAWKSKKLSTIKTLNFIIMPKVLVIHLSRFFYDLTKKNETMINYPLILDIVLKNNETARYRLYGIVNHFGTLISGHYTSLVNKHLDHEIRHGQQKWYYFDDEVVKRELNHGDYDKGITSVSSSDVYVLFYERI